MTLDLSNNPDDIVKMLNDLKDKWVDSDEEWYLLIKRYLLTCARAIWKLLPQEGSRRGIEVTEQYMMGLANEEEYSNAEYASEGAAFNIDYNGAPADIKRWISEINLIPEVELSEMIHPGGVVKNNSAKELLLKAAYFAHFVMVYPDYMTFSGIATFARIPEEYLVFLSPAVLREILLKG